MRACATACPRSRRAEWTAFRGRRTAGVAKALVRSLDIPELKRAFTVTTEALLVEIERSDPGLAGRLAGPLRELAR